jgi:hypothetical protein
MRIVAVVLAAWSLAIASLAGAQDNGELQIKAAFLFKFGDFVDWPEGTFAEGRPFTIGVIGAPGMAEELSRLAAGRTVQGRPVTVRRLARDAVLDGLHVLFVGRAEAAHLAEIAAHADGLALLTVSDSDNALASGIMINFVAAQSKVRFDIALPPAERGGIRISARLLSVARKVAPS